MHCRERTGRQYCISAKNHKGRSRQKLWYSSRQNWQVCRISVIERAKELMEEVSALLDITEKVKEMKAEGNTKTKKKKYDQLELDQISLFDTVS